MGLITGLLTLPLAPVRGTMWIAEMVLAEAEKEDHDEASILVALQELEEARAAGELSEDELEQAEDALLERLIAIRGVTGPEAYGPLG